MDKCIRCGCPIIKGMRYMTFEKKGEFGYMCMDCVDKLSKEAQKQAQKAKTIKTDGRVRDED